MLTLPPPFLILYVSPYSILKYPEIIFKKLRKRRGRRGKREGTEGGGRGRWKREGKREERRAERKWERFNIKSEV